MTFAGTEQHTLREPCTLEGVGLHTGAKGRVRLVPQPPGSGIVFRLDGAVTFPAHADYIVDTRRATVLGAAGRTVSTVEHVLSALCGMEVDNVLLDVTGPEIPIADGSARIFVEAIESVGRTPQGAPRAELALDEPRVYRDERGALVVLLPADRWTVRFAVEFPSPVGAQYFAGALTSQTYRDGIAPARTFGYLHEVEALLAAGLAQGGSLENALVFGPDGPLVPLRQPNEVVAHKVLDLIGDLALAGARPRFGVIALRSGHELHARVTRDLRSLRRSGLAS
ncbi:MAG: UDP-3-O-[3-hydroxymyristoyl] N-acetylglucosamine deacetylase [Candidatus Eremiobacteraeota bacterium]|nr:UDP-3-O-[3-hydroxymyristoyl] N-acetylglucosamine deacetylase [Candidatus Eremiobacteraeota bacterium]